MMTRAWLVKSTVYYDDDDPEDWNIVWTEPDEYSYAKVIPIAYTTLTEGHPTP